MNSSLLDYFRLVEEKWQTGMPLERIWAVIPGGIITGDIIPHKYFVLKASETTGESYGDYLSIMGHGQIPDESAYHLGNIKLAMPGCPIVNLAVGAINPDQVVLWGLGDLDLALLAARAFR
jgi:hypothetical protein